MPLRDGTGPWGLGAGTGRGKGGCYTGGGYKGALHSGLNGKHGWLLGILLPVGTAILRDVLNPSGVLRRMVHAGSCPKIKGAAQKTQRDAEFTIMETNHVSPAQGKKPSE